MPKTSIIQGTEEWLEVRAKGVTATDVASLVQSRTYVSKLISRWSESSTSKPSLRDQLYTPPLIYGRECEGRVAWLYDKYVCPLKDRGGFWRDEADPWLLVSPDALDQEDRCVEIKCPISLKIPKLKGYIAQVKTQMHVMQKQKGRLVIWMPKRKNDDPPCTSWERGFGQQFYDQLFVYDYTLDDDFGRLIDWIRHLRTYRLENGPIPMINETCDHTSYFLIDAADCPVPCFFDYFPPEDEPK